jgi:uncharacterized protein (UPF0333 family)
MLFILSGWRSLVAVMVVLALVVAMAHLLVQNLPKASMTKTLVQAFVAFNKACAIASLQKTKNCKPQTSNSANKHKVQRLSTH